MNGNIPLVAFIGRLDPQKGADILLAAAPEMLNREDMQLVCLGSGNKELEVRGDGLGHFNLAVRCIKRRAGGGEKHFIQAGEERSMEREDLQMCLDCGNKELEVKCGVWRLQGQDKGV